MMHINSLSNVLSVCSTLHSPVSNTDTALTLTLYSVPASSPVRIVEVAGGEPEMAASLPQEIVPFLLYCTWYRVMFTLLWGVVQVTLRIAFPLLTALDRETPVTWEGACRPCVHSGLQSR